MNYDKYIQLDSLGSRTNHGDVNRTETVLRNELTDMTTVFIVKSSNSEIYGRKDDAEDGVRSRRCQLLERS